MLKQFIRAVIGHCDSDGGRGLKSLSRLLPWLTCLIGLLATGMAIEAPAQIPAFAFNVGHAGGFDRSTGIATDPAGNVIVTGIFNGIADFDPGVGEVNLNSLSGNEIFDIFVAKYNPAGNLVFAFNIDISDEDDRSIGIATDAAGNVLLTGFFEGTADFDPGAGEANLTSNGSRDIFVAKYDPFGKFVFAFNIGNASGGDQGISIATDAAGNVLVTGSIAGTVDFDPGVGITNLTGNGIFVAKYDSAGNFLFAFNIEGGSVPATYWINQGPGIATDAAGNVLVTGSFNGTVDFDLGIGEANLTSNGSRDIFVAKYDPEGNLLFAFNVGNRGADQGISIATDTVGNMLVAGYFERTVDFDPGVGEANLTSNGGNRDIFVVKYDPLGNFVFAFNVGDTAVTAIATDPAGNVLVTGSFNGTVDFDPGVGVTNLTSNGDDISQDVFVAKYDPASNLLFAFNVGDTSSDLGTGIATDTAGNVLVTGWFIGTVDFDPGPGVTSLTSNGSDFFVVRYTEDEQLLQVLPDSGGDTGQITVQLFGVPFQEGVTAKLIRIGETDIVADPVEISDDGRTASATFDLTGQARGLWDVVVTNPDGTVFTLPEGFTIEEGRGAQLWAELVGSSVVRVGRPVNQWFVVGNSGDVDARTPWLEIALPSNVPHDVDVPFVHNPATPLELGSEDTLAVTLVDLPAIAPGQTIYVPLTVTPSELGDIPIRFLIEPKPTTFIASMTDLQRTNPLNSLTSTPPLVVGDPTVNCPTDPCPEQWRIAPDADPPPAGYICWWDWGKEEPETKYPYIVNTKNDVNWCTARIPGGNHIAKSIGGGQVIELWDTARFGCPEDHLRVNQLDTTVDPKNSKGFQGCYKPVPRYDQAHASLIVQKANAALKLWVEDGDARWSTNICSEAKATDDSLVSDCMGFVHLMDPELMDPELKFEDKNYYDKIVKHLNRSSQRIAGLVIQRLEDDVKFKCDERYKTFLRDGVIKILTSVNSIDPNDKHGPEGTGSVGYITSNHDLAYVVRFENQETATAPAQEVVITDQLDTVNMDLSTFSLGPMSFSDTVITPPFGLSTYTTDVDLRPDTDLIARVAAKLDVNTGRIEWRFSSIDPETGLPTTDPLAGFLPPNANPPEGDGSVLFTVMPKNELPTGTEIRNAASIVFDTNEPIVTPEWSNIVDNDKPESAVLPLASTQSSTEFEVQWEGTDVGAGVRDFTVFFSKDNGPFSVWLRNTPDTSATFAGENGETYAFYSVARDLTSNVEEAPSVADANTQVVVEPGLKGDLNGNSCVDRADYNILMADIRGPEPHNLAYDLNNDGAVNRADARTMVGLFTNPKGALCIL